MGCTRRHAYRLIERLKGSQHRDDVLRVTTTIATLGKGARRKVDAVLWPVDEAEAALAREAVM